MATTQADVDLGAKPTRPSRREDGERRIVGSRGFSLKNLAGYIFLVVITIYWLALAATKNNTDLFSSFGLWFADFNLVANIEQLFTREGGIYLHWIANSALYAGVGGVLGTLISVAAGYALAKYQFFGRSFLTA